MLDMSVSVSADAREEGEAGEEEEEEEGGERALVMVEDNRSDAEAPRAVLATREPNTMMQHTPARKEGEKGEEEDECGQRVAMLVQYYDGLEDGNDAQLLGEPEEIQQVALCTLHPSTLAVNGGTVLSHRCQCKLSGAEFKHYNALADALASVDVMGVHADAEMLDIGLKMVELCDQDASLQERVIRLARQQGML
jgi:hypothetical protein